MDENQKNGSNENATSESNDTGSAANLEEENRVVETPGVQESRPMNWAPKGKREKKPRSRCLPTPKMTRSFVSST